MNHDFPLVCVGGSAGGLDAYKRLLENMPADLGAAVVIVNHLRQTTTLLHEILPCYAQMPVELITDRLDIKPNCVFIIPPQRDLHILHGEFRLKPISKPRGWPDVVTVFLRSLAQYWQGKLIAIIVSGFDGDGADALCEIRDVGGVTIAQRLDTAGQPDMPASAIASGCVDFILSPEMIPEIIREITQAAGKRGQGAELEEGRCRIPFLGMPPPGVPRSLAIDVVQRLAGSDPVVNHTLEHIAVQKSAVAQAVLQQRPGEFDPEQASFTPGHSETGPSVVSTVDNSRPGFGNVSTLAFRVAYGETILRQIFLRNPNELLNK